MRKERDTLPPGQNYEHGRPYLAWLAQRRRRKRNGGGMDPGTPFDNDDEIERGGLVAWLRAQDVAHGQPVTSWPDHLGTAGVIATAANAGASPALLPGEIGSGKAIFSFDGAGDYLTIGGVTYNGTLSTQFALIQTPRFEFNPAFLAAGRKLGFSVGQDEDGPNSIASIVSNIHTDHIFGDLWGFQTPFSAPQLICLRFNGLDDVDLYVNDMSAPARTFNDPTGTLAARSAWFLGADGDNLAGGTLKFRLAEYLLYSEPLEDADLLATGNAILNFYGI